MLPTPTVTKHVSLILDGNTVNMGKFMKNIVSNILDKCNFGERLRRVGPDGGVVLPRRGDPNGKVVVVASKVVDGKQRISLHPKRRTRNGTKISFAPDEDAPSATLDINASDFKKESERVMEELKAKAGVKP
jgi:hypothetical protein